MKALAGTEDEQEGGSVSSGPSATEALLKSQMTSDASNGDPFEFLVPISLKIAHGVSTPQPQQQQTAGQLQPSIKEQPLVESVAWALFSKAANRAEWTRSVDCPQQSVHGKSQDAANSKSLSDTLKQIDASLAGKRFMLVACGPLHLRQHLHPIARRLKVPLADYFYRYIDLLKEFERRPLAQQQQQTAADRAHSAEHCPLADCTLKLTGVDTQQQVQQQLVGFRKRLEEILKTLDIPLDAAPKSAGPKWGGCADCLKLASGLPNEKLVQASCALIERLISEGHQFNGLERIKRKVEVGLCEASAREAEQRVVRARGLPWQATEQDIADFFLGLNIPKGGVALCLSRQGRRNGEALIQFESREHRNLALGRHKHFMGNRYIEVYRACADDFMSVAAGYSSKADKFLSRGAQAIVRMRGLPFTCTARQVVDFFAASQSSATAQSQASAASAPTSSATKQPRRASPVAATVLSPVEVFSGEEGVLFVRHPDEKPSGDAFVLFASDELAKRALTKHHQNIGARYVELFRSTVSEVQQVLSVSAAADNEGSGEVSLIPSSMASNNKRTGAAKEQSVHTPKAASRLDKTLTRASNAFPALPSKPPVAWQRGPEAATYAQVAHQSSQANETSSDSTPSLPIEAHESASEQLPGAGKTPPAQDNAADTRALRPTARSKTAKSKNEGKTSTQVEPQTLEACENTTKFGTELLATPVGGGQLQPCGSDEVSSQQASAGDDYQQASVCSTPSAHSPISSLCSSTFISNSQGANSAAGSSSAASNSSRQTSGSSCPQPSIYQNNGFHHNLHHNHYHHQNGGGNNHHHNHSGGSRARNYNNGHHSAAGRPRYHHHDQRLQGAYGMQAHHKQPMATYATAYGLSHAPPLDLSHQLLPPYAYSQAASHHHHAPLTAYDPLGQAGEPHLHPQHPAYYQPAHFASYQTPNSSVATTMSAPSPAVANKLDTNHEVVGAPQTPFDPSPPQQLDTTQRDCIRLRGLPFEAQIEDVIAFLGRHSEFVLFHGVHMVYSAQGQPTGEAIIQMNSCEAATAVAQEADRRVMCVRKKQRYIEVIPSSIDDLKPTLGYGLGAFAASRAAALAAAAVYNQMPAMMHYTSGAMGQLSPTATLEDGTAPKSADRSRVATRETDAGDPPAQSLSPALPPTPIGQNEDLSSSASADARESPSSCSSSLAAAPASEKPAAATRPARNYSSQHQQSFVAATAAAAAAYYPIFYYYPPQQMLATATGSPYH